MRSVTVRESEFSAWDRVVMLEDRAESKIARGSHGFPLADATDPENQFGFTVLPPTTDFAQKALNAAKADYRKRYKDADMDALLWNVERSDLSE